MSLYDSNGNIRLTAVDGSTRTGAYAPDGSLYIVLNDGSAWTGIYHSCGAFNAVLANGSTYAQASNGSLYVNSDGSGGYNPNNPLGRYVAPPPPNTLIASRATYTLTGQDVNLTKVAGPGNFNYVLPGTFAAFVLNGETMTSTLGYTVAGAAAGYTLAGQDATLTPVVSYSSEALAVFAAMTTPPSTPRKDAINAVILGLKTDGIWTKLDALQVYAAADSQAASVDWVLPSRLATVTNAPTFTTDRGYTTNGTSNYVDTTYNPSTGTNFTQNSAMFALWSRTIGSITTSGSGWFDGTDGITINPRNVSAISYRHNSAVATNTTTPSISDGTGWFAINRDSSTTTQSYRNGSAVTPSGTATSSAVNNHTLLMGAITAASFQAREWAAMAAGGSLTSTEHANLYTRIQTYMTAVGA